MSKSTGRPGPCAPLADPVGDKDHVQGPRSAPVVLVEYGDYECPYCHNAFPVVKELQRRMDERLAVVYRHFPQNSIHPHASAAAQAAEAAGAQGKFWEMHERLFHNREHLADADLIHTALRLGLEVYRFQSDMENPIHLRRIRQGIAGGIRSGVKGTPAFFINGCRYEGPPEFEPLLAAVEAAARGEAPAGDARPTGQGT